MNKYQWTTGSGLIVLELTQDQIELGSHQGDCYNDVSALIQLSNIKTQLDKIDNELIIRELSEYGAWDREELENTHISHCRLVWIACCDCSESPCDYILEY